MKILKMFVLCMMVCTFMWGLEAQAESEKEVVVVLDPGHDSKHCGAWYSGLGEETANLKIAKYCKEELEKYEGVKVYLTRTGSGCPFPKSKNNKDDIKKRVKWADSANADVYVCLHLNASNKKSDGGAMVFYSKYSSKGKKLARKIQNNLTALGLKNNGIKKDYHYAAIKTPGKYGITGVLVEHAFMSNKSDMSKFIKNTSGLKKLGVADAKAIAEYYDLKERSIEGLEPVMVSAEPAGMDVKVKWKKLTGAEGYHVLRKTNDSDWECVKTTTSTEWIDDTVYADTAYTYTVQAYKAESVSEYNETGVSVETPEKKLYNRYKTTMKLKYRSGPGTKYLVKGTLKKNKSIYVEKDYLKTANGYSWCRFLSGTRSYYTKAKYLKELSSKDFKIYKTICKTECFENTEADSKTKGKIGKGEIVWVVSREPVMSEGLEWAEIYKDGNYYWIKMDYLR